MAGEVTALADAIIGDSDSAAAPLTAPAAVAVRPVIYHLQAVARIPQPSGPPTLTPVERVPFVSLTWVEQLNGDGELRVTAALASLPADVKSRLADLRRYPTELWLLRDGVRVFAGPVLSPVDGDGTVTIQAAGLAYYCRYMALDADYRQVGADLSVVARYLIDQWQALDGGHFGLDTTSLAPVGVTTDVAWRVTEQHIVRDRLQDLTGHADGFDLQVDPVTRKVVAHTPRRGVDRRSEVILDRRAIATSTASVSVAAGEIASEAFGIATGQGLASIARLSNTDLRATFGRAAVLAGFDVRDQVSLDGQTRALLDARAEQTFHPGVGLIPVAEADPGAFGVGDTVTYRFDGGLGLRNGPFRVAAVTVEVSADGAERMAVEFAQE